MFNAIEFFTSMDQGWLLVLLTSIITLSGCCVVYTDIIYEFLFPQRAKAKPFHIAQNTDFLVCSLALSSGSLLFTSLYKLLPKGHSALNHIPIFRGNQQLLKITEYSCYFSGIIICSLVNVIIHLFTNESLVHCAHESPVGENAGHSHSHGDNNGGTENGHSHSHSHENSTSSFDANELSKDLEVGSSDYKVTHSNLHSHDDHEHGQKHRHEHNHEHDHDHDHVHGNEGEHENENDVESIVSIHKDHALSHCQQQKPVNPHDVLLPHSAPRKTVSLMDLSLRAIKGEKMTGDCYGDIECCTDEIINKNKLHNHKSNDLHFCSKPSEENVLFFPNKKHMITDRIEFASRYPNLDIHSPLIAHDDVQIKHKHTDYGAANAFKEGEDAPTPLYPVTPNPKTELLNASNVNHSLENDERDLDLEEGIEGEAEHHHHIKTPLSRLLSIGLQTILAITLHKFPEGFIMYSTSKTNPELGMTIFLSMFIHNFVEGFTMTLPLYIALNSRAKAILISGTLGGLSQPIGALLGYYMFRGSEDMEDTFTKVLIAVLLCVTSGFLTFISLQMFASAIGFGGKQETVLKWAFIGISLICLSNILI